MADIMSCMGEFSLYMEEKNQQQKTNRALQEEAVLAFWKENNIFQKTLLKDAPMGNFVFYDGPPTANGMPGLHHVEPQSFKDAIPRYKTMRGYRVPRKAGWDTHGLPVELQVEKELGLKSKKEIEQFGVAAFNQKCKESVWKYKEEWMKMRRRMAFWTDLEHPYITYSNDYIEGLWGVIAKANDGGHLYKDFKVLPWCTRCGTALSSHELNQPGAYKDIKDLSVYMKFKVKGQENTYILAWTTTPWTLPGNVALAVGKDISYIRYTKDGEHLVVAKELALKLFPEFKEEDMSNWQDIEQSELFTFEYEPLFPYLRDMLIKKGEDISRAFRVYVADFVNTDEGTGIVHTAVMYGQDDFELGTVLGLPKLHLVNEEGKFVPGTDFLEGRYVRETDENGKPTLSVDVISDLKKRNLFFAQENVKHSYPHCWRCDTALIYYARDSWYFRMSALRDQLLTANEVINWEPEHIKEGRFGEWLEGIKDWAISRDRYWGTPIPVWTNEGGEYITVDSVETLRKLTKTNGNKFFVMRHGEATHNVEGRISAVADFPDHLTDAGRARVLESAQELKEKSITAIYCSPYLRSKETAGLVAEAIGFDPANITCDDRLQEYKFGDFNGKTLAEYFTWRKSDGADVNAVPLGGESHADARKRMAAFFYDIEKRHSNENILVVSHGIALEVAPAIEHGYTDEKMWETWAYEPMGPGGYTQIDFIPLPHNDTFELDLHRPYIDEVLLERDGQKLTRTKEVMDVWFDSGAMPYAQDHAVGSVMDFSPFPADYISEAIDQTRGWFYTLHAVSNLVSPSPRAAFKNVICLGHILDAEGKKMSKSKGNVIDPWDIFNTYGADAIRFWMYSVNQPGDSKNFDEKTLRELHGKVFTLLENVITFYELYRDRQSEVLSSKLEVKSVLDQWIIARLNQLISETTESMDAYDLFKPTRAIRDFIDDLSTWYLRRSRDRLKDGDSESKQTLYYILKTLSQVIAPFAPFAAEDMWQKLKNETDRESVHLTEWPTAGEINSRVLENMRIVRDICTEGNALRKKENIPVRQPLGQLKVVSFKLEDEYKELIKEELNVKDVVAGTETKFDTTITPQLKTEGEYRELVRVVQDLRKEKGLMPTDTVAAILPERYREVLNQYESQFMKTAGVSNVKFTDSEDNITIE